VKYRAETEGADTGVCFLNQYLVDQYFSAVLQQWYKFCRDFRINRSRGHFFPEKVKQAQP
jgi:hypothetical protein